MWVSTKAQYGMRALVEIALAGAKPLSLKVVSERQGISYHYLEQIIADLRKAGIVASMRGAHGGYIIARPLDEITALDVVELMEGSVAPVTCIEDESSCERVGNCSTEGLWHDVDQAVRDVLAEKTLAHLVAERYLIQLEEPPPAFHHDLP